MTANRNSDLRRDGPVVAEPGENVSTHAREREMAAMVQEALALAPDRWGTHVVNGAWRTTRRDWLGADSAFANTKALAPPSDLLCPYYVGYFLQGVGRCADAAAEYSRGCAADPLSLITLQQVQQAPYILDRVEEARADYERTLSLAGNREPAEHTALMWIWDTGDTGALGCNFAGFCSAGLSQCRCCTRCSRFSMSHWPHSIGSVRLSTTLPVFKWLLRDLGIYDYWRRSGKWGDFARPLGEDDFEIVN